jgi:Cu(I)/Ag(I) efflux system membrane protein CusA/SilA
MLSRVIELCVRNRVLVGVLVVLTVFAGVVAVQRTPLDAIPDLSDVQVIIQTDFTGQAPQIVEDQVTYPISTEMLKVPGARTVRGYSFFGVSFVYVIFEDGTDLYWARSRVLEYLSAIQSRLPESAQASLGPDATGLGWVYQYVLEDTSGRLSVADLRSIQDWYLRYQLTAVPGVSEVASIGGFERMYEVVLDPVKLRGFGIPVHRIMEAIRASNQDVGANVLEMADREYMIRGLGYLRGIEDLESVVVAASDGTPVRVSDLAAVRLAPQVRRGVADLNGTGDAVGGIVVMRFGENALQTIQRVKERLAEVEAGLPEGVVVRPVYDRSDLILRAIDNLRGKLLEESLVIALVCLVFLVHARSALVAIITLPLGVLMAFIAMRGLGIGADIMSLGGIAIAIGAMIDAAIVLIENLHVHMERALEEKYRARGEDPTKLRRLDTRLLSSSERWDLVLKASKEVGPALFFTLLIITVSFLPVFALEAQEGRLFKPLAWTKSLSMASAAVLSITVVPVAMGLFIRGKIFREVRNPVSRGLKAVYLPVLRLVLNNRWPVVSGALAIVLLSWIPYSRIGGEFMPPLDEGSLLYMPTTLPGISVQRALETIQFQDSVLAGFPEVENVFGKAGRANTATDPAPLSMFETTITLRPKEEWRPGMTMDRLIAELDRAIQVPGITNSWTMPIKGRIDMLATGIRTPVGVKIFGPDLEVLEQLGREVEAAIKMVPGARSVFAERVVSGSYLDIVIDREAAARHGLAVSDVQMVIASAIGGMTVTETVEGRERYGVRVRYPQELRDRPEKLAEVLVPLPVGGQMAMGAPGRVGGIRTPGQIPLGQIASIEMVRGPSGIKTEGAFPTAWVFVDVEDRDLVGFVEDAQEMVASMMVLPAGYTMAWSGQFEFVERAEARLSVVIPATVGIVFLLLYLSFGSLARSLIVLLSLPFALVGGLVLMDLLSFNWSVATAVGFIALAGVAAETGVIMLIYLDQAWNSRVAEGRTRAGDLREAIEEGAAHRVRPKMMTVSTIILGLLPMFWGHGTGSEVMRRIAAPMVGGMVSATLLTLLVIPAVYSLWQERRIRFEETARSASPPTAAPVGAD